MLTPNPAFPRRTWLNGRRSRLRGLGDNGDFGGEAGPAVDPGSTVTVDFPQGLPISLPGTGTSSAGSGGAIPASSGSGFNWNNLTNLLSGVFKTTAQVYQQQNNPLFSLQPGMVIQQTPQGGIYASNVGAAGAPLTAGLNTASLGSMLPILLVGGGVVLLMMMGGRR